MLRRPLLPQRPGRAVDGGRRDGPQWTCGGGVDKQTVSAGRPSKLIPAPLLFDSHAPQAVTAVGHTQV
ncbi:hypothetical protein SCALM49S_00181 [Streptomyces californicus]